MEEGAGMNETLLRMDKVSRSFGGLLAVREVTVSIGQGELVGLIGPNGAGKTTLLDLISGVLRPISGTITFGHSPTAGMPPYRVARLGIGRTFQVMRPFKGMTVLENALLGALFTRNDRFKVCVERAEAVLEFLHLADKRNWPISRLTLADVKRLEVAKALATEPRLLLLDEVMAGLNPREIEDVMIMVDAINGRGVTVLMIEHLMQAIMGVCRRVIVLHHGQLIADEAPARIVNDPVVIKAYLGERYARRAEAHSAQR
jgi:branched-chain amino acid transport system ATP-binding protein